MARDRSPSIQKCSELKPPNISERPTSNLSDSSRRDCPFFPPCWISSEVCSGCHTRHADAGFLTKVDLACLPADWHVKIFLVAAIIGHLAHIFFEGLQINHSVVAFGIIVTAEPGGDKPRLTDFVMHELVTVDFRNVDRHLGLGRPGGCKGKDGYQGDADALPWHKTLLS